MPVAPTYPGVYIEEIPSGVRTIVGVATSVGAFLDRFRRGPLNEAVQLFSFADFEREFGGLDERSEASYGIQQFFLNGGAEAHVVRVGTSPIAAATAQLTGPGGNLANVVAGRRIRGATVQNPGSWGNALRLEVDHDVVLPDETVDPAGDQTLGELFNLTVAETELRGGRTFVRQTETFRNLTLRAGTRNNALEVVNAGSKLIQLNRDGLGALATPPPRPNASGTLGTALPSPVAIPASGSQLRMTVDPDGPGGATPSFNQDVTLDYGGTSPTTYVQLRPFLENAIRSARPTDPLFATATVQLVGGRFRVLLGRSGPDFNPAATAGFVDIAPGTTATDLGLAGAGVSVGPQQLSLSGGQDSGNLSGDALRGVRNDKTGLYALEDVDLFNILCIPAAAELAATQMRAVYAEAEAYCEERRSFLIVDIPRGTDDLDAMQTWLSENETLRHRNAAVYFPRVRVADALNQGRLRSMAASGTMAGLYARTDASRGVWKAPAGTEVRLRNVQDLDYKLTDRENGALNPVGVNCLRNFPVFGNVAWGARTLDGADQIASEWKYIPVRRLALFLEESLFRGTKWVVFEPNDEPLWSQIRLNLGAFMQNLFRQGAFQGQTPREAYFVKCDDETTTQTDINLGIVNIVVGFAPLKPAEFVIIKIQQMAGQIPT